MHSSISSVFGSNGGMTTWLDHLNTSSGTLAPRSPGPPFSTLNLVISNSWALAAARSAASPSAISLAKAAWAASLANSFAATSLASSLSAWAASLARAACAASLANYLSAASLAKALLALLSCLAKVASLILSSLCWVNWPFSLHNCTSFVM